MQGDIELAVLILSCSLFLSSITLSAALVIAARQIAKGLRVTQV
jgi:hypothetical protein